MLQEQNLGNLGRHMTTSNSDVGSVLEIKIYCVYKCYSVPCAGSAVRSPQAPPRAAPQVGCDVSCHGLLVHALRPKTVLDKS
ncbi:hypothetical protein EVAR_3379_1 [Eumeta japonica]|uniref:Uncharacterized protein n=1 Tax=Eumeta variegata TaxID=151549 RepID=A0A4C1SUY2_EUMVA|nr:hypothetical protein EVAR_3379_1 [Eumeta japonica]